MGTLSVVQTIWAGAMEQLGQCTILTTTGGAVPQLILDDPSTGTRTIMDIGAGNLNTRAARVLDLDPNGSLHDIAVSGRSGALPQQVFGVSGDSGQAWLDCVGFAGNLLALHRMTYAGQDWMLMSAIYGKGIGSYRIGTDGAPVAVTTLNDSAARYLSGVSAIDSAWVGGTPFVVTASSRDSGISVFQLGSGGQLWHRDQFGAAENLPIDRPTALETVQIGARHFVIAAGFGTSSLTVLELDQGGTLRFADQISDTRETRFGQTSVLDSVVVDGRVFIAAGGADGGVSLFQMLPNGRLVHRDTLIDTLDSALDGLSGLKFVQRGAALELFALSTRDTGLTRIDVDIGPAGVVGMVSQGTSGNDVIGPAPGQSNVNGGAGDDILMDGNGAETLHGGAGADLFVIGDDGQTDVIADFDPSEDRLDIFGHGALYGLDGLSVSRVSGGLSLRWGDEHLIVRAAPGARLTKDTLEDALVFETDRVIMPEAMPQIGTSGSDTFIWTGGADTINGAGGWDWADYSDAPQGIRLDLRDSAQNGLAAEGDVLTSIERVIGSAHDDLIFGDDGSNTLQGLGGNDTLHGGGGADWIVPGTGANTVTGGAGSDMLALSDLPYGARISLAEGRLTAGGQTSTINGFESVTGTIHADVIEGDSGDNRLRGLGEYDWFLATTGADSYDGGSGRDMISYVYAPGPVTVNLATGKGLAGLAAGDTYTSIERVTGSIHSDVIWGGAQDEDIRGLGGYDWFIGSPGVDRFDGGSGVDIVAYWTSPTGVVASLAQGRGAGGHAARDLYTSIEGLTGSGHADVLTGDNGRNVLRGLGGADTLDGYGGVDRLEGGAGDDIIDGGWGWDLAIFSGDRDEYAIRTNADGSLTVTDSVRGRDGTDHLVNIETLAFDDGWFYF